MLRIGSLSASLLLATVALAADSDSQRPPVLILADNKPVTISGSRVTIPTPGDNVYIRVGYSSPKNSALLPAERYQFKLDGFDTSWEWHSLADMGVVIRFYNRAGDIVLQRYFAKTGVSAGWRGAIEQSPLTPCRETLAVPADADTFTIGVTSAGPSHSVGTYVVAGLTVSAGGRVLLPPVPPADGQPPANWVREGTRPTMAKLVTVSDAGSTVSAFCITDNDPAAHADWLLTRSAAIKVTAGETLALEWRELYSIGSAEAPARRYQHLPPGHYRLLISSVGLNGEETPLPPLEVTVPVPYWKQTWFWLAVAALTLTPTLLLMRAIIRARVRNQVRRLQQEHAVELERLRIARNLHDDLGARLTSLSLVSDAAENEVTTVSAARQGFHKISDTARELVGILYEAVWSVDPENDNLEALLNYLSRMIGDLCEPANLRCRILIGETADRRPVTSEIRHHITLAVKEAVHNAIKYSGANELTVSAAFTAPRLTVSVRDNGRGFDPLTVSKGRGLANMSQRMTAISGVCEIESTVSGGTTITFVINL